mmetsp:Transcript_15905/g.43737  ORF Transcript_15905/g.43737 Transcript_15905/m.43737 type:complete len:489 (-) Transcript_15905:636-2102(-)
MLSTRRPKRPQSTEPSLFETFPFLARPSKVARRSTAPQRPPPPPPPRDIQVVLAGLEADEMAAALAEVPKADVDKEAEGLDEQEEGSDDHAFDVAVSQRMAHVPLDSQQSANIFALRLSRRACRIRDRKWGGTSFHVFESRFPQWVTGEGDKADMTLKEWRLYVDAVPRLNDDAKQRLITAGGGTVLQRLTSGRMSGSVWGALTALTTSPSLREAFFNDVGVQRFCERFCKTADSLNAPLARFLCSIARSSEVAACLLKTGWFDQTLDRVFFHETQCPCSMEALVRVANVPFNGAYVHESVICALMGPDSPTDVRTKIVRKFLRLDVSAWSSVHDDPIARELVAILGISATKGCTGRARSASAYVWLTWLASLVVSRLVQCPEVQSALFRHASSLNDSLKGLALIRLHNLCSDERARKHDDFQRYVQEHPACFHAARLIHTSYIHGELFRKCQERAWWPGAGDDAGPAFKKFLKEFAEALAAPSDPSL